MRKYGARHNRICYTVHRNHEDCELLLGGCGGRLENTTAKWKWRRFDWWTCDRVFVRQYYRGSGLWKMDYWRKALTG